MKTKNQFQGYCQCSSESAVCLDRSFAT